MTKTFFSLIVEILKHYLLLLVFAVRLAAAAQLPAYLPRLYLVFYMSNLIDLKLAVCMICLQVDADDATTKYMCLRCIRSQSIKLYYSSSPISSDSPPPPPLHHPLGSDLATLFAELQKHNHSSSFNHSPYLQRKRDC